MHQAYLIALIDMRELNIDITLIIIAHASDLKARS